MLFVVILGMKMYLRPSLTFFPISSFPSLPEKGEIPSKAGSFVFDLEVKPGWIRYKPYEVTVLSYNEMLQPTAPVSSILQVEVNLIQFKLIRTLKARLHRRFLSRNSTQFLSR